MNDQNKEEIAQSTEEEREHYYSGLSSIYDGGEIVNLYLQKKNPRRMEFSDEEREKGLERLVNAADVARGKLNLLKELWARPYGKRFYHHTITHYSHLYKEDPFSRDNEDHHKILEIADSIMGDGILSKDERKNLGKDTETADKPQWQGSGNVSLYDDTRGSYYESDCCGYGGSSMITFIIDQKINDQTSVDKNNSILAESSGDFVCEKGIHPKHIVAAYIPEYETQNGIGGFFGTFYDELIIKMIDNPELAFPILTGTHHHRPLDNVFENSEENASILASPRRAFFGR